MVVLFLRIGLVRVDCLLPLVAIVDLVVVAEKEFGGFAFGPGGLLLDEAVDNGPVNAVGSRDGRLVDADGRWSVGGSADFDSSGRSGSSDILVWQMRGNKGWRRKEREEETTRLNILPQRWEASQLYRRGCVSLRTENL